MHTPMDPVETKVCNDHCQRYLDHPWQLPRDVKDEQARQIQGIESLYKGCLPELPGEDDHKDCNDVQPKVESAVYGKTGADPL